MTRSDLIKAVSERYPHLTLDSITKIVMTIFKDMSDALVKQGRIELRGFGSFSVRKRSARVARNPRTNEVVNINDRHVVYFRMGKGCKERINNN